MDKLTVGIMAHVDAGKTTLSEALLYAAGAIRTQGRVDHGDAFLDTHELERARGITIFSKQARFSTRMHEVNLLDTPGHADFSAEMERVLPVLDYAILVVSATDGVQAHTKTIWRLLDRYKVPAFIFVNKTDIAAEGRGELMKKLRDGLSEGCVEFSPKNAGFFDDVAMCDEAVLEKYLENGSVDDPEIVRMIKERRLFPCYFGSALKVEGIVEFTEGLDTYAKPRAYPAEFAARVYKITRDEKDVRLTWLKVTGGEFAVRDALRYTGKDGESFTEKITQIRLYSGDRFEAAGSAGAGMVCAVTGLSATFPGQGLGGENEQAEPLLEPVLSYRIEPIDGTDKTVLLQKLRQLAEEDPALHIEWNARAREINARIMGEVQTDILVSLIEERYGVCVRIDSGRVLYRETIEDTVEGVGHFEPLRHYAEAHILLSPLPAGSGIKYETRCSEDILDKNWQRLILTHLREKTHLGVLTGAPVTDICMALVTGRSHPKHTEGGDFREATYRAVRQGLMQAKSVLLEPVYRFVIEVPSGQTGRALNDVRAMYGSAEITENSGETAVIEGEAPVACMAGYNTEIASYTHGQGRLSISSAEYRPCHNAEDVIREAAYGPEADLDNSPDSVFCSHGAGVVVKWNEVPEKMHLEYAGIK